MEVLPLSPQSIARAAEILHEGGIVAHATETCYGLACDLQNKQAVTQLFRMKERPETLPVSALFESIEQAKLFVDWQELAEQLAIEHLPGPLTIVAPLASENVLFPTPAGGSTIGIRISPHPVAVALVKEFGVPVSTTSANIHSLPNPYSAEEIQAQYSGRELQPDLLLDSGALEEVASSSVVDVSDGTVQILRKGALDLGE